MFFPGGSLAHMRMQVATLATEGLTWWGIANGLGAHTQELNPYELSVQFKVTQTVSSATITGS